MTTPEAIPVENMDDLIKQAENDLIKKNKALERAQSLVTEAENLLTQLKTQRDLSYINSLTEVDWELVFNYSPDQTMVVSHYREQVFNNACLNHTFSYNSSTMQPILYISFETDSVEELNIKKSQVEFIFMNLKFQPKEMIKCIEIRNMLDSDCLWQLTFSAKSKKFAVEKSYRYQCRERHEFDDLETTLTKIQQLSKVALESQDMQLIG